MNRPNAEPNFLILAMHQPFFPVRWVVAQEGPLVL
jgi:hypothetical protein